MIVAQSRKEENIAEYLLYMWQVEDLVRANRLDINEIKRTLIPKYNQSVEVREEIVHWYERLIEMMKTEGVTENGHLQINKNVVNELVELHQKLLKQEHEQIYHAKYNQILPLIVQLRARGNSKTEEIETCFNAIYGYSTLKLQGKEISQSTADGIKQIATFLSILAEKYKEVKTIT